MVINQITRTKIDYVQTDIGLRVSSLANDELNAN